MTLALAPLVAQDKPGSDPFADLNAAAATDAEQHASWLAQFFKDNFAFRGELMAEFTSDTGDSPASRQSVGFEMQKKFSTATSTVASFDFQGRLVRRDGYNPVLNDLEGVTRAGWTFEYHNLYLDLYHIAGGPGRFNFRVGHFYVPFGLNPQTDTHGTVLQLSNETNFGFERDWYAGFWGSINRHVNYDVYYATGSGYDLKFHGQKGLAAARLSLGNRYRSEYGLEGGISAIAGERLADNTPLRTQRAGADVRYRHTAPGGSLTFTTEVSAGRDAQDSVTMDLQQAEYLRASRRWGVATQFRRFSRDRVGTRASAIGEFTWYFRNDVAGANEHWIKLNVERQIQNFPGPPQTIVTLQYYWYR